MASYSSTSPSTFVPRVPCLNAGEVAQVLITSPNSSFAGYTKSHRQTPSPMSPTVRPAPRSLVGVETQTSSMMQWIVTRPKTLSPSRYHTQQNAVGPTRPGASRNKAKPSSKPNPSVLPLAEHPMQTSHVWSSSNSSREAKAPHH